MSTRTVRHDEHGLYVRIDGSIYRPEVTVDSRLCDPTVNDTKSRLRSRSYVDARIVTDTPFAKVDGEIWHDHGIGQWFDHKTRRTRQIDSRHVWNPISRGPLTETVLRDALRSARAIAWDGCHKIYVLMDDEQVRLVRDQYGYSQGDSEFRLIKRTKAGVDAAAQTIKSWFDESCGLRFVNGVRTDHADPNAGFFDIVAQCDDWVSEVYQEV